MQQIQVRGSEGGIPLPTYCYVVRPRLWPATARHKRDVAWEGERRIESGAIAEIVPATPCYCAYGSIAKEDAANSTILAISKDNVACRRDADSRWRIQERRRGRPAIAEISTETRNASYEHYGPIRKNMTQRVNTHASERLGDKDAALTVRSNCIWAREKRVER